MRKILFFVFLVCSFKIDAQHQISGSFTPSKDYNWLIAYRLKPGTQVYAADTAIKNGEFTMSFAKNMPIGTYRLVYAVPQEEFYFDLIYNGKEDIEFSFNQEKGVLFTKSDENILFSTYFKDINAVENDLIAFYSAAKSDKKEYNKLLEKYQKVQESYENTTEGLMANQFVRANRPYIPSEYESLQKYIENRKNAYFKYVDVSSPVLQASGFLTDKLINYVFTALPLQHLGKVEVEKEIQENVNTVFEKLEGASEAYIFHVLNTLWTQSLENGFDDTANFIYNDYLKISPEAANNKDIINKIEIYNRLRVGVVAPEITWKKNGQEKKLSTLRGAENYILVFWSSTCGHCLNELPALHEELKDFNTVKVIAVGLENDDISWTIESEKLPHFEHVITLGKWESEYAKIFDIHATPTYFVLDTDKKIIAKPEMGKDVLTFLNNKS